MKFKLESAPHARNWINSTTFIMFMIIVGLIPAIIVHTIWFGYGFWLHLLLCAPLAALCESVCLKLRGYSAWKGIKDLSIQVTVAIYCLAIPPYLSLGLTAVGIIFATLIVKQCFGGLGQNTFNPAMAAYVLLLVSAPGPMSDWQQIDLETRYNVTDCYKIMVGDTALIDHKIEAFTTATPLSKFKVEKSLKNKNPQLVDPKELQHIESFFKTEKQHFFANGPAITLNLAYGIGGILLIVLGFVSTKYISATQSFSFIAVMYLTALLYSWLGKTYDFATISPMDHLVIGATMMGAFFIITDPVSSPTTTLGKIISASLIAFFVVTIRTFGNYPDAVAFGALLGNSFNPLINKLVTPRKFGDRRIPNVK